MTIMVSLRGRDGKYEHHHVEREVYYYIRQLEEYIKNPEYSNLKEVYSDRFGQREVHT